jgi:hypothetical protein
MEHKVPDSKNPPPVAELEAQILACPQHVVAYVRLARQLEEAGDLAGAASVLQDAHFFLPNSPSIISGMRRLSEWVDTTRAPITISTSAEPPAATPQEETTSEPSQPVPDAAAPVDELDQLIEGLEQGRGGRFREMPDTQEQEWSVDDGLLATETLAQIYVSQNQFEEAILVYGRLAEMESDPEKAAMMRKKAADLRGRLRDSND